ncbi:hypothetical protein CYA_1347 [Synechococcus sp. JA-3-3Ab]|nr:hypothetical protein CYA_1347 [Synechococcus sp. JA-3-3Ab]
MGVVESGGGLCGAGLVAEGGASAIVMSSCALDPNPGDPSDRWG